MVFEEEGGTSSRLHPLERPKFGDLLTYARPGDTVHISEMFRLVPGTQHILAVLDVLHGPPRPAQPRRRARRARPGRDRTAGPGLHLAHHRCARDPPPAPRPLPGPQRRCGGPGPAQRPAASTRTASTCMPPLQISEVSHAPLHDGWRQLYENTAERPSRPGDPPWERIAPDPCLAP
ncbi:hypothetical protein ACFWBX_19980 [Streptomyces sp. NPDC059991]|uniref:hypothetical protein n=1 Tax=Streptomyces sp. NPDC059991 TaxID=3347028 RepID=UPI00368C3D13